MEQRKGTEKVPPLPGERGPGEFTSTGVDVGGKSRPQLEKQEYNWETGRGWGGGGTWECHPQDVPHWAEAGLAFFG